jgi:hypothetical protein
MRNRRSSARSWSNMDYDILVKIFMTVNVMDLISSVSLVCSSWHTACCDPVIWKKLDLSMLISNSIHIPPEPYAWSDEHSNKKLMKILRTCLNLSHGNVTCLVFHFYVFIKNEHLVCAAQRYNIHFLIHEFNQINMINIIAHHLMWTYIHKL